MEKQNIRNTLFGLMIIGLLATVAQDAMAQHNVARSDVKRPQRSTVKKDKTVKQSPRQAVRKDRTSKSYRTETRYAENKKHKGHNRDYNKGHKSYRRNANQAYTHANRKNYFPIKKWHHGHYRRPAWVDYHRPGYRYPKIGMHVSVLPYGHISFILGNIRFYACGGVYYRYDPALRVYLVVNKPTIRTWYTSDTWDRIILTDGSSIEGIYRYSENDMVFFGVGDALLEIPMSEIKVLYLSEN